MPLGQRALLTEGRRLAERDAIPSLRLNGRDTVKNHKNVGLENFSRNSATLLRMKRYSWLAMLAAVLLLAALTPALAKTLDFDALTIADINKAFDTGALTAEKLVQICLARIQAYDRQGPSLHAVLTLNPKALETARALDAERKTKGPRSPLHGIPIVLKDNYNTFDLPTTGGSVLLEGSIPPADAFVVQKLRAAGAIVLAKLNMSEFASGPARSSLGGQTLNPHDLTRTPSGSSGGTGVAIAAAYAPLGLGTDTGGSIRGPSTSNGIVGLKPTHGLMSRSGIIPLSLSFDTGGPMARSVSDIAVALGVMTGIDDADAATKKSEGKFENDYTKYLKADTLKGARIGIARDFVGADPDVDWVMDAALDAMRKAGATIVDVRYPKWLLDAKQEFYNAIRRPEFHAQIADYLSTTGPGYPKTLEEMIERANRFNAGRADGAGPNPARWTLFKREVESGTLDDYRYTSVRDHGLPMVRAAVEGMLAAQRLDAIVYPTSPRRPGMIAETGAPGGGTPGLDVRASATDIANLTGFPDLIVPAGFTGDNLPVGISFFGPAFSEPKLLALGYGFEQATHARRRPVHTPARPGESISVP
jgi:amidase